jgi:hypothetical protein|tara:strand:+ start:495 stop:1175 length:681 start_codon:yes stop_codon:yes gene_type:complete
MSDILKIGNIPTAITDNHNEVLRYWKGRNRTLLHVDAHSDLADGIPYQGKIRKNYYGRVDITNFICAAAHLNIISEVYWLNPHSDETRIQYFGDEKHSFKTKIGTENEIEWKSIHKMDIKKDIYTQDMDTLKGYILDIDLDAFCCINGVGTSNLPCGYDSEEGYEQRIQQTIDSLMGLKPPKIITIARSIGFLNDKHGHRDFGYIPLDKVDEVERLTIEGLRDLYE